jgi:endonuclease/exonuclease/phosphatase family metal-dependent hydrolase
MDVNMIRFAFLIIVAALLSGCAARARDSIQMLNAPPCENAMGILWAGPKDPDDRARLVDWCQSVGGVLLSTPDENPVDVMQTGLTVLTWNKHVDFGDLEKLLRGYADKPLVALVQEVARASPSVPIDASVTFRVPRRIGPRQTTYRDITAIAQELNLSLVYLPSMPNGFQTGEDRGNAILSTMPISDVIGIELPWVSQRRVAIMATVTAIKNGLTWQLRIVNMHLDNRSQRWSQAAAVVDFLSRHTSFDLPTLIGGDLNAWFGIRDKAVRIIDRVVPRVSECGDAGSFRLLGLNLDHLFTTLPKDVRRGCFVHSDRFGSDHYPIVLHLFKKQAHQ